MLGGAAADAEAQQLGQAERKCFSSGQNGVMFRGVCAKMCALFQAPFAMTIVHTFAKKKGAGLTWKHRHLNLISLDMFKIVCQTQAANSKNNNVLLRNNKVVPLGEKTCLFSK